MSVAEVLSQRIRTNRHGEETREHRRRRSAGALQGSSRERVISELLDDVRSGFSYGGGGPGD